MFGGQDVPATGNGEDWVIHGEVELSYTAYDVELSRLQCYLLQSRVRRSAIFSSHGTLVRGL